MFLAPTQIGGPVALGVVKGSSMQPALHSNDLVVAYRQAEYAVGDVVIYEKFGGFVIHKIVMESREGHFLTRGINNGFQDSWTVDESDVKGKLIFTVPWVGGLFVMIGSSPLFAGFAGVAVASLVLLPSRKRPISKRALDLLQHAATERRHLKPWMVWSMTMLWVLVVASIAATTLELVQGFELFPRVALTLVALSLSFALLIGFWEFNGDGRGQPEPKRSMAILGPRLHRLAPDLQVIGANDTVVAMRSAAQLRNVKEHGNLPVFHQIDIATKTHKFLIVTDAAIYTWQVQSQIEEPKIKS